MLQGLRALPCVGAWLAGIGNEIEFPDLFTVIESKRANPVLRAEIGARRTGNDEVAVNQWRHREIFVAGGACNRLAPQKRAVRHIERNQVAVSRAAHEFAVLDGGAAIGRRNLLALGLPDIAPALVAGLGIDRDRGAAEGEI